MSKHFGPQATMLVPAICIVVIPVICAISTYIGIGAVASVLAPLALLAFIGWVISTH